MIFHTQCIPLSVFMNNGQKSINKLFFIIGLDYCHPGSVMASAKVHIPDELNFRESSSPKNALIRSSAC